jgi:hypothetical protein
VVNIPRDQGLQGFGCFGDVECEHWVRGFPLGTSSP